MFHTKSDNCVVSFCKNLKKLKKTQYDGVFLSTKIVEKTNYNDSSEKKMNALKFFVTLFGHFVWVMLVRLKFKKPIKYLQKSIIKSPAKKRWLQKKSLQINIDMKGNGEKVKIEVFLQFWWFDEKMESL
jgi:hypothetical protein